MNKISIKILNTSEFPLPEYKTLLSAGCDIRACLPNKLPVDLMPGERRIIYTGIYIALPDGYEAQIRPRSGECVKRGLTVLNGPSTIDADYRGEIGVIIYNADAYSIQRIQHGDRIAQMVISEVPQAEWELVFSIEELSKTTRGAGAFGHTGVE